MELNLTAAQYEKAAEAIRTILNDEAHYWGGDTIYSFVPAMVRAAAPHLQAQPQQVSGSLLQRRCQQAREALGHGAGLVDQIQLVTIVSEVLRRDADELLADLTADEWSKYIAPMDKGVQTGINELFANRRARLFAPPVDPEERVTVKHYLANPDRWIVLLDGANPASTYFGSEKDAEIYRTGLIAQLRADATLKEKEQRIHGEPVHLPANAVMGAEMLREAEQG